MSALLAPRQEAVAWTAEKVDPASLTASRKTVACSDEFEDMTGLEFVKYINGKPIAIIELPMVMIVPY